MMNSAYLFPFTTLARPILDHLHLPVLLIIFYNLHPYMRIFIRLMAYWLNILYTVTST